MFGGAIKNINRYNDVHLLRVDSGRPFWSFPMQESSGGGAGGAGSGGGAGGVGGDAPAGSASLLTTRGNNAEVLFTPRGNHNQGGPSDAPAPR
jgi:hypothetical protein